jgi:hypothetical protein
MPKDMIRVAPMLILSTLPFANYIVFPLVWVLSPKPMYVDSYLVL